MERTLYLYNTSRLHLDSFFQCSYFDNLRQMEKEYFNALSLDKTKKAIQPTWAALLLFFSFFFKSGRVENKNPQKEGKSAWH